MADSKIEIRGEISFSRAEVKKALSWGKRMGYTYERDGEFDSLLIAAMIAGIVHGDFPEGIESEIVVWRP